MTLRRQPQDFQVDERLVASVSEELGSAWSAAQPYAVYRLSKTGLGTPEAVAHVCRTLRAPRGAVSYAGLKDRHAVTGQHISVHAPAAAAAHALPADLAGAGWRVRRIGWTAAALDAACIACNDFVLVVRNMRPAGIATMDAGLHALSSGPGSALLVNYFGDQRFGSARHGRGFAAAALVEGDFLQAIRLLVGIPVRKDQGRMRVFTRLCAAHWGDWTLLAAQLPPCPERAPFERLAKGASPPEAFAALPRFLQSMCVEAFQSLIWNETVRRMVLANERLAIRAPDDFGELLFSAAADLPAEWRTLDVPLLAPGSRLAPPWGNAAQAALEAYGLTPERLRIPGLEQPFFGEALRPILAQLTGLEASAPEPDELGGSGALRRTVRFSLPRGAYATVFMRALGE